MKSSKTPRVGCTFPLNPLAMVVSGRSCSNRKQKQPSAEPPPSLNPVIPKGTKKRSYLNMADSLPVDKADLFSKLPTVKNEARQSIDVKPTIPQARNLKRTGFPPADVDQGRLSIGSLRSMKFKKTAVIEELTDPMGSGASAHVSSASLTKCPAIVKKHPEGEDDQEVTRDKQGIAIKKEPDTNVDLDASRTTALAMLKQEPRTKDDGDFVQTSRKQSIIHARTVEADRIRDEAVPTTFDKRSSTEMNKRRTSSRRESPGSPSRQGMARPTSESKIKIDQDVDRPKLFSPYFDKKIRTLRSPLPLTIFDPRWQEAALTYEATQGAAEGESANDEEASFYHGYPYPNEFLQSFREWTLNHMNFHRTLRDVYKLKMFAGWILKHKANADAIYDRYGFMMALRYDIHVRANTFAFRVIVDGQECVSDLSILNEGIQDEALNRSRGYDELGCPDNPYLPGGSKYGYDPITHQPHLPESPPQEGEPQSVDRSRHHPTTVDDRSTRNPRYKGRFYDPNYHNRCDRDVRRSFGSSSYT